jgi:uncharacterized protein YqhQ
VRVVFDAAAAYLNNYMGFSKYGTPTEKFIASATHLGVSVVSVVSFLFHVMSFGLVLNTFVNVTLFLFL